MDYFCHHFGWSPFYYLLEILQDITLYHQVNFSKYCLITLSTVPPISIAEGVLAIEMGATATDLKLTIHPHPTLTETVMEAAEMFFGSSTHIYKRKNN